jgi:uncharacterized protein GlcG (DUF336 family)
MELSRAQGLVVRGCELAADAELAACIAVVDSGGHLVAFGRMEGCSFMTIEIAIGKAWTAAASGLGTDALAGFLAEHTPVLIGAAAAQNGRLIPAPGGAPIKDGDEVIGGIGVSGGGAEQDQQIADATAA